MQLCILIITGRIFFMCSYWQNVGECRFVGFGCSCAVSAVWYLDKWGNFVFVVTRSSIMSEEAPSRPPVIQLPSSPASGSIVLGKRSRALHDEDEDDEM